MIGTAREQAEDRRGLDVYLQRIGRERPLTSEEEAELAQRIRQGDEEALAHLTRSNLRFVVSIAKQYTNRGLELCDLINEGNLGLLHAARRFDETRGCRFVSYAVWWIRHRIVQALRNQSRLVRLPASRTGVMNKINRVSRHLGQELGREPSLRDIAERAEMAERKVEDSLLFNEMPVSLDWSFAPSGEGDPLAEVLEDPNQEELDTELMKQDLTDEVGRALQHLQPRERHVLTLYYGIGHEEGMTLEEIGRGMNLTRERVRQIKEKALSRLRHSIWGRRLAVHLN
jgi:RNA polymerase primary sigma factor